MVTRALEKYIRISPKKLRPVAELIRKKKVDEAIYILLGTNKKGASVLKNVIESALANAKRIPEKGFTAENLLISRVNVDGGPFLKRYRAMSMGRAGLIRKRTSHVLVELEAVKGTPPAKPAAAKRKAPARKVAKTRM